MPLRSSESPSWLLLNQMGGPLTRELAEYIASSIGPCELLTGSPDILARDQLPRLSVHPAPVYRLGGYLQRGFSWLRYLVRATIWVLRRPRGIPLVLFTNPPVLPFLGFLFRRMTGRRYVVVVHDVYPDLLEMLNFIRRQGRISSLWRALNRLAYESAEGVITLSDNMAETLSECFDATRTRLGSVHVVPPWVDTDVIQPIPKSENPFAERFDQNGKYTVMYSGKMGASHDIETIVEAAYRLKDRSDIRFLFIGEGPKRETVRDMKERMGLDNVMLLPWQSEETLPFSLAAGDISVVSLEPGIERCSFPSKAVFALSAGSAMLTLSRRPNVLQELVERHGCGVNVEPGDVGGLVRELLVLCDNPSVMMRRRKAAREAAQKLFSRDVNVEKLGRLLQDIFE